MVKEIIIVKLFWNINVDESEKWRKIKVFLDKEIAENPPPKFLYDLSMYELGSIQVYAIGC